jgi:outer membrane protein TolC
MHSRTGCLLLASALAVTARAPDARAQETQHRVYTLDQAVTEALAKHPLVREGIARERAADARVDEASTRELPSAGVSAQLNRSTGNTPPGAWFITAGFPTISGAPRGKTLDEGTWQTGVSLWASWDLLSLTRDAAAVDAALAGRSESAAATNARRLDVAYAAADAFVSLVEAQETVRAAKASVERAQVIATMTQPLVDQSLRAGADAARAQAEVAAAQTMLARAEQAREVRRAELAQAMGDPSANVDADPGGLANRFDDLTPGTVAPSPNHPDIVQSNAAVVRAEREHSVVEVEYLPRLDLVAAIWLRGSGLLQSPADGFVPDIPNWAAGVVVTWSALDIPAIRARARASSALRDAAVARRDETYLAISGELSTATSVLEGARRVARQTPVTLTAARAAEQQVVARYKAGLSPVVDVADAERVLTQADIDDAVARLEVCRGLLLLARASGDLGPFLARARVGA